MDIFLAQIINFALIIGIIYAIARLVKNSNATVKHLENIEKGLKDISGK